MFILQSSKKREMKKRKRRRTVRARGMDIYSETMFV